MVNKLGLEGNGISEVLHRAIMSRITLSQAPNLLEPVHSPVKENGHQPALLHLPLPITEPRQSSGKGKREQSLSLHSQNKQQEQGNLEAVV